MGRNSLPYFIQTKNARQVLVLGLVFLFYFNLFGQQIRYQHFSVNDGLAHNQINMFLQDSRGFLWIATADGLNRYDGYNFTTYTDGEISNQHLIGSNVRCLFEDSLANLWIGTAGLSVLDRKSGLFTHYTHNENDAQTISEGHVTAIFKDSKGNFWVGTEGGGLNLFDENKKTFTHFQHKDDEPTSISNNNITAIFEDNQHQLWIGTGYGLNKMNVEKQIFTRYMKGNTPDVPRGNRVTHIFEDSKKRLWFAFNPGGVAQYHFNDKSFTPVLENTTLLQRTNALCEDDKGLLLLATSNGLVTFSPEDKTYNHQVHQEFYPNSLSSNYLNTVFKDDAGIIWLGTFTTGINKFEKLSQEFEHLHKQPNNNHTLSTNNVSAFTEDADGNIWIGTKGGGLNKLDLMTGDFVSFQNQIYNPNSLSFNTVLSLESVDDKIWIGTNMLDMFNPESNTFTHYAEDFLSKKGLKGSVLWTIEKDSEGILWIGALNYLNRVELDANSTPQFKHYTYEKGDTASLGNGNVTAIHEGKDGTLWVAANGLNKLLNRNNPDGISFKCYQHSSTEVNTISSNNVICIHEDSFGKLWIGTTDRGLNKFDPLEETFVRFGLKEGLPADAVYCILEDDNKNLWMSTSKGIVRMSLADQSIKTYSTDNTLPINLFNNGAGFKASNGKLYFGGVDGIVTFFPDKIKDNLYEPKVCITDLKILNESVQVQPDNKNAVLQQAIQETDKIKLTYKDYVVSFEFAALHYSNPSKNKYAFKMDGLDKDWNYVSADARVATYSNLKPGKYTFLVKATNVDNKWIKEPTQLKIIVAPPPWRSWWAYIIYSGIFVGILLLARNAIVVRERFRSDLKMQRIEAQKSIEINQMKLNFFTNVSHEFRTPLTLIIGPLEKILKNTKLQEDKGQFETMLRNAKRLLRLVNQIMDIRKVESGSLKLELTKSDIVSFINNVTDSFRDTAKVHQLEFSVSHQKKYLLAWFDPDKLEKIIFNLLSNAFKYTPDGGKVSVVTEIINRKGGTTVSSVGNEIENQDLIIKVIDSGLGIAKEELDKIFDRYYNTNKQNGKQDGTGIGLELTRELVNLHHGSVSAHSEEGKGSTFKVVLPLGKSHYDNSEIISAIEHFEHEVFDSVEVSQEIASISEVNSNGIDDLSPDLSDSYVLVVEDNYDVRKFISSSLDGDIKVIEATNGEEGLTLAKEKIPDLILTDVMMPVMDGIELCHRVKKDISTSHIPVVMLTARGDAHHKIEGLQTGADDYITKPFSPEELSLKINNILETRRQLRSRFGKEENFDFVKISSNSGDEKFLKKAIEIVEKHMANSEFDNKLLIEEIGMSRTQLYRKLKALTNQSVHEFIRTIRLKKALDLLKTGDYTISEITYEVGFNNHSYFNKCFKDQYGQSPSEFIKKHS